MFEENDENMEGSLLKQLSLFWIFTFDTVV